MKNIIIKDKKQYLILLKKLFDKCDYFKVVVPLNKNFFKSFLSAILNRLSKKPIIQSLLRTNLCYIFTYSNFMLSFILP